MSESMRFGDWVSSYRNGYGKRPAPGEGGPIVLRIADVSSGVISIANPRRGLVSEKDAKTYRLSSGDLLFVRVNGAREIVGRCAVVSEGLPTDMIFNDHLIRVQLKPGIDPRFAKLCMASPATRAVIEVAASTSAGQLTINQELLDSIRIPRMTLADQVAFAERVESQLAAAKSLKQAVESQLAEIERLPARLLAQAFGDTGT